MSEKTGTVRLHRVLKAPPERVYRAFVDREAMVKWLPPYGFTGEVQQQSLRVGGSYRMSFTNFSTGHSEVFSGTYKELEPGRRLRYVDIFENPQLPGEMEVSITFTANVVGTTLEIVQTGIPAAIPADMCYLGWQESLAQLARLVEPNIPDNP
jgi:uncharacterized protein YndB with AHSA1/START domain